MTPRTRVIAVVSCVALLALATVAWRLLDEDAPTVHYRTASVRRGDLVISIGATGTVEPEEVIDVGAQVAGQIFMFGKDVDGHTVDYGSFVDEGTILARIDDSLYSADADRAQAQVRSAKASLLRAEADIEQTKAKLRQAERDWKRAQKLGPSEALAQASYDAYQSAYETARANVDVGEAAILQARADLLQAEASDRRAQKNLGYCTIKSPVKGVIIDRRVNIGQTVVASLNAPSLFLIAKDLKRMQVWVPVNEADIGRIHPGRPVTFTVDAYPDETFRGTVGKIRLNASMTQNVVTYTVEVVTDNTSGRLLPYLTANVQFELDRLNNVTLVPSAALHWSPSDDLVAPAFRGALGAERAGHKTDASGPRGEAGDSLGRVWVADGSWVRPIRVQVGLSDGTQTEVRGEGLNEGQEVVTGVRPQAEADGDVGNPFVPSLRRH